MPLSRTPPACRQAQPPGESWICLLRAINVGGHGKVSMSALRAVCEELGAISPQTYIQSGNVVFRWGSGARDLFQRERFAESLEAVLLERHGIATAAILRTLPEWREAVAGNPFPRETAESPAKVCVIFLQKPISTDAAAQVPREGPAGERLVLQRDRLVIAFPTGMGNSKLNFQRLERILGVPSTARNWNSVLKLLELAEGAAA